MAYDSDSNYKFTIGLLLILMVGAALRFFQIGEKSLWVDEFSALRISAGHFEPHSKQVNYSPFGTVSVLAGATDSPLYFMTLNLWIRVFSNSAGMLRALSAIFGIAAIGLLYPIARGLLNKNTGLISALVLAIAPLHIIYSQEARPYTLEIFLILASTYFFIRIVFAREMNSATWSGYLVAAVLAIYTHHLALFVYVAHNLFLFVCRRDLFFTKRWIGAQAIVFVGWLVEFFFIFRLDSVAWVQTASAYAKYWPFSLVPYMMAKFTFADLNQEIWHISRAGFGLGVILFATLCVLGFLTIRNNYGWEKMTFLLMWLFVPLLLLIGVDIAEKTKATLAVRYLIAASPPYYILIAAGVDAVKNKYLKTALIGAMVMLFALALSQYYQKPKVQQWKEAAEYINRETAPIDVLIDYPEDFSFIRYYTRQAIPQRVVATDDIANLEDIPKEFNSVLILIGSTNPFYRPEDLNQIDNILSRYYQFSDMQQWQGVQVRKYSRKNTGLP